MTVEHTPRRGRHCGDDRRGKQCPREHHDGEAKAESEMGVHDEPNATLPPCPQAVRYP
jgi:hypothetical protein